MINLSNFPLRQKILIGLTVVIGFLLLTFSIFDLLKRDTLNTCIFIYSAGIPMFLLMFDSILDLNNKKVFNIWLIISVVIFGISLMTYHSDKFIIQRNPKFDKNSGINDLMSVYSTSSLKALLIFLSIYWGLNRLLKKQGLFIINTFKQREWYHDGVQREITALDVFINFILFFSIIISVLFGY